jgi:hypothetical protein
MSALVQLEGGWSDPMTVACEGLPLPGRCLLSPAAFTPAGASQTIAIELHTSAVTLAAQRAPGTAAALAGLLLLPGGALVAGRSRRRRAALVAALAAAALLGACSGGGGSPADAATGRLSPGTYAITIRATSAGQERTATVNLTVTSGYTSPY